MKVRECPFCGGESFLVATCDKRGGWFALCKCLTCNARSKRFILGSYLPDDWETTSKAAKLAVEVWNSRVADAEQEA